MNNELDEALRQLKEVVRRNDLKASRVRPASGVSFSDTGGSFGGGEVTLQDVIDLIAAGTLPDNFLLKWGGGKGNVQPLGTLGATETIDLGNGNKFWGTLDQDCTIGTTGWENLKDAQISVELIEDGTGGWTPTFTGVTWIGGTPTWVTTAGTVTHVVLFSRDGGTTIYGAVVGPGAGGAPTTADYLVGTAQAGLSAEIVVGATPGGELGNTWASPTVDSTHSGSAHTDFIAKAIVDVKGDLIVATAADTVARVAAGTNGHVLKANSGVAAGVEWAAESGAADILDIPTAEMDDTLVLAPDGAGGVEFRAETGGGGGGALVLLEQYTASASATLDFTTFISATYDEYQFEFINIVPATNSVLFYMRMSTNGGSTFATTAYSWDAFYWRAGGSGVGGGQSQGQIVISSSTLSNANAYTFGGTVRLFNPASTAAWKTVRGATHGYDGSFRYGQEVSGAYESTTAVNAIRFLMSSGNIASGIIRVYGIAK